MEAHKIAFSNRLSAKQTAVKAATDIVVAKIGAGFLTSDDDIEGQLSAFMATFFTSLMDELEEAPSQVAVGFKASPPPNGQGIVTSPGEYKYTWGKMVGKTVAEVEAEDSSYHDWLVTKDDNPARNFMRGVVQQYRAAKVAV